MRFLVLACSLTLLLTSIAWAQESSPGPEAAVYPQIGLGQFGWDAPEVATIFSTSANPAAMAPLAMLRMFGINHGAELDASQAWFGRGFSVNTELYTFLRADRRGGVWRVSWFSNRSNRAPIGYLSQDTRSQVAGDALSFAYARQMPRSKWRLGVALAPLTQSWIRTYRDGTPVGQGYAQGAEITLGAQYLHNSHLTFGLAQRYQSGLASYTSGNRPARRGSYHAYSTTLGCEWKPNLRGRTTLFADVQYVALRGSGIREDEFLLNGGINYRLNGRWTAGLSTNYVSMTYGRDYDLYAGITWAFANSSLADRHFGRSSMLMLWVTKSW